MASETPAFSMADRRKHVRAWKKSGLTAREYAERAGLNHWTLHGWATRLNRKRAKQTQQPAVRFVPASVEELEATPQLASLHEPPVEACVELEIKGVKLRLPSEFHENTLRRVLDVLEARS
jgi:transposase-like protein